MKKLKLLMVAFMAMVGLGANAADYKVDQRFSTIDELDGKLFAVVNETAETAIGFGVPNHGNEWDMYFGTYAEAYTSNACYFKISAAQGDGLDGYYYLQAYKLDGTLFNYSWAAGGYFNSQKGTGGYFALGLNNQNGQDALNHAVWAIEVSEGKFALKNIGTGKYLHADQLSNTYDDPFYFTFGTLVDFDQLKADYNALKEQVLALDDDATIFSGDATIDISAAETAIAAATSQADIDAAMDLLRQAALDFVTSVTVNEDKYFDLTNIWIVNPTVSANVDGWTVKDKVGGTGPTTNYGETEFYNATFDFYQTLTLPKGTYEFGVTGFHRAGNHSTYFYAGDDKILIPGVEKSVVNTMAQAQTYFDNGNGKVSLKFALESESNTMKIGIINNDTQTDKWTIFRNFTLHYYGSAVDYSVYQTRWAELVTDAGTAKTNHPSVTGQELTNLNNALNNAPDADSKKADYIAKIDALEAALNAFNAAATSYDKYVAYRAETVAAFGEDLAATVAAPTTAAEALTAVQDLNIAQYNEVADNYTYSCSGLIGDFGSWTGTATYGEAKTPSTPNYLSNEHWSGQTHAYYEQCAEGWNDAKGWTIKYEKTCTLPAGEYVIKVAARTAGAGVTSLVSCSATGATVTLPAESANTRGIKKTGEAGWSGENSEYARDGQGYGWQWRFLPFTLSEQAEVTMTFYAEANSQYQWMSIADGELLSKTKVATDVTYDETAENNIEDELIADVTINRTIKEGFNTVVLPFNLTANQVAAAFGTGTEVYNYSENSENAKQVTVSFTKGDGSITANVPVLVKATAASESQTFEGVQIQAATSAKVVGTNCDFVGTYEPITIANTDYFIGNGAIYKSAGNTTMNAFRAYINAKSPKARISGFFIDGVEGTTTEIEGLEVIDTNNDKLYNLNGQEVKKAQKGLYIQNGKKIVVK
ncbi:MAG: DUF5013 domain-containing protein [Prevotella sp.]|nr:DUF5013 domain-containing protein [Prevotella sp.]